jgi:hypothetical protein
MTSNRSKDEDADCRRLPQIICGHQRVNLRASALAVVLLAIACSCFSASAVVMAAPWADDPLVPGPGFMTIKKRNLDELRARIAFLATSGGYTPPMAWTDPTITAGTTQVKAAHINQIRRAVENILQTYAGRVGIPYNPPTWAPVGDTNTIPSIITPVRASHFLQPRVLLDSLYNVTCGNGRCDGGVVGGVPVGEDNCSCPGDCPPCPACVPPRPACPTPTTPRNGICEVGENRCDEAVCPGICCGDGACDGPQETSCNCPLDCPGACPMPNPPPPPPCNSDGDCDAAETCACPLDNCWGPCCGLNGCEPGESNCNCPADCGPAVCPCGATGCCGNGVCEVGENTCNCRQDCPGLCCGNGWCESFTEPGMPMVRETAVSCPGDCGNPADCRASCLGAGFPFGGMCLSSQVARFAGFALDGTNAPRICADYAPPPYGLGAFDCTCFLGPFCGDGQCGQGENCGGCPADCLKACGNGCCEAGPPGPAEDCFSCPQDCNLCGDNCCQPPEVSNSTNCCRDCPDPVDGFCCWDAPPPSVGGETVIGCAIPRYSGSVGTADCIPDTLLNGCCEPKVGENRCNIADCYGQPGLCDCNGSCGFGESGCNCPDCVPTPGDGCCLGGSENCGTEPACC